ncbi:hypothetical protein [Yersinia wautersii]|uniref:hypothetical protein n=1 Tax=Yersinia wautersii TaxID=1341643 RepID=UPI0021B30711|nr:hypothetical protein [Yersinia wautersii]
MALRSIQSGKNRPHKSTWGDNYLDTYRVHNASAKTMHHKKAQKPNAIKNTHKTAPKQEAQAAKKHHKAAHSHKAPTVAPATK